MSKSKCMKSTMLVLDSYGEKLENTVFDIGYLDIGNNFTLDHLIGSMTFEQVEFIFDTLQSLDLSGNARINAYGNYCKIRGDIAVYDLWDHVRFEYDKRLNNY